jgi:hypothetical protein
MSEFNIKNSNIEQFSESGSNYKVTNNDGPVVISGSNAVQTTGSENEVDAVQSGSPSILAWLWAKVKSWWKVWFGGGASLSL